MILEEKERADLRDKLFFEVFLPQLYQPQRWTLLVEAQRLVDEFNQQNGAGFCVRDMFVCAVKNDEGGSMVPDPSIPLDIVLEVARLTVEDCQAALLIPSNRELFPVIKITREMTQLALKAWSSSGE